MKLKASFIVIAAVMIFIAGCKKEESKPIVIPPVVSYDTTLLFGKTWMKTAETFSPAVDVDGDSIPDSNIYPLLDPCETDNEITFSAARVVTIDEGGSKCDIFDPQTTTGTYRWNGTRNAITATFSTLSKTLTVLTLDSTTLKFQSPDTVHGVPIIDTETFTAM